jgi:hypothetical protein
MNASRRRTRSLVALFGALAFTLPLPGVLTPVPVAYADNEVDRGQARDLGTKANEAAAAGDWAKAEDLFHRADTLYHAPTLLLGLARARAHLGKYVEAYEDYHRIIIEPLPPNSAPAFTKAVADARVEISSVEGKRARAIIDVKGPSSPSVTLDGAPVAAAALGTERAVNPGSHALHVEAAGYTPSDTTFTVAQGDSVTTTVTLQPAPAGAAPTGTPPTTPASQTSAAQPPASPEGSGDSGATMRTLGWIGLGVGGAGLLTGAITGFVAVGQHSNLQSNPCDKGPCGASDLSSYQSSLNSYQTMGTVSTVALIAGGVLASAGAVLLFTAPHNETSPAAPAQARAWLAPYLGLMSAGAVGAF